MMTIRPANERGHAEHGWLDSYHSFSFADYYDPQQMGFRALRVINEDRVAPGRGFGTHPHRDMEIISYVLEGQLQHRDSMGTGSIIRPGDVQRMSAGTGVLHSEYNASATDPVHFLQIWLLPGQKGIAPSYEQKTFVEAEKRGRLRVVASPDGRDGSVTIHTDALVYAGVFEPAETATLSLAGDRHAWVQIVRGALRVNGKDLAAGDGAAISGDRAVELAGGGHTSGGTGGGGGEVLVFDLA